MEHVVDHQYLPGSIPQCIWDKWGKLANQELRIHVRNKSMVIDCLSSRGHNYIDVQID